MAGFAPMRHRGALPGFDPTCLVPALDAERRAAAAVASCPVPTGPDPIEIALHRAREAAFAAGRAEGHAAGLAEAAEQQSAQCAAALAVIAASLSRAEAESQAVTEQGLAALARLVLGMLDAALPRLAARESEAALLLARRLAPALASLGPVRLRIAPALAESLAAAIGDPRIALVPDATVAPGDARAEWQGGEAAMDLAERRRAIRAALADCGIALEDPA